MRAGAALADMQAMLATLCAHFEAAGCAPVEPAHLFPAEALLDVYGEDVRARAFLFPDPVTGGELCLRPDFTMPVALAHGRAGWEAPGRYTYQGAVFRRQDTGSTRPVEYLQAGIEEFGGADPAAADAQVFATIYQGLEAVGAPPREVATGDLGIVFALLDALDMPEPRRAELRRHVWRPARFHALLEEFCAPEPPSESRRALIQAVQDGTVSALAAQAGEPVGQRTLAEIEARAASLAAAADMPPLPAEQAELIEAVLAIKDNSGNALARIHSLTSQGGADITRALDRFERRLDALNQTGFDADDLPFDAAFGRNLEYYNGFVFEMRAKGAPDLPPLAGGGRYDAITARLGAARAVPAVGGMIRPEAVWEAKR
ncbi:MAG: ATP phosphoribosyltransferase regulatory subunit [Pseudomonadota bacterium]